MLKTCNNLQVFFFFTCFFSRDLALCSTKYSDVGKFTPSVPVFPIPTGSKKAPVWVLFYDISTMFLIRIGKSVAKIGNDVSLKSKVVSIIVLPSTLPATIIGVFITLISLLILS